MQDISRIYDIVMNTTDLRWDSSSLYVAEILKDLENHIGKVMRREPLCENPFDPLNLSAVTLERLGVNVPGNQVPCASEQGQPSLSKENDGQETVPRGSCGTFHII